MFCGGEAPSEDSFFRAQDSNGAIGCLLDIGVWRWKPTIRVLLLPLYARPNWWPQLSQVAVFSFRT